MSATIKPFPELRALAEAEAEALYIATKAAADAGSGGDHWAWRGGWGRLSPLAREWHVAAHLALLTDLTRPASRDAVARLVAEKVGLTVGATAPGLSFTPFSRSTRDIDGAPYGEDMPAHWWLFGDADGRAFVSPGEEGWIPEESGWTGIDGISEIADPSEALAALVAHLWPGGGS